MSGADERDLLFGRLFGYLAIIRSERLSNDLDPENNVVLLDALIEMLSR
jgi:hypothetical protein